MLEWDPVRVVDALLRHMPEEYFGIVRWSIGRVLRWSEAPLPERRIEKMHNASSALVREAAFDLAGWRLDALSDDVIRNAALTDTTPNVRFVARDALQRRVRLRQVSDLLVRFATSTGSPKLDICRSARRVC
jgi:hypothetical protein